MAERRGPPGHARRTDHPVREVPEHVLRPLLSKITDSALDEDYRHVAERSAERSTGRSARWSGVPALVAVAVLGLLLSVAAVETSRGRSDRESGRASLVAEAQSRRALLAEQQERLADLREASVDGAAELAELAETDETVTARRDELRSRTGYGPVSGPGIRVEYGEPPGGDPADDLTLLLDGLWNAGAEAVSVNGRRIATLTRLASTGPAVSVDGRSLAPPYVVLAVGDPATMQAQFAESTSGAAFRTLADTLLFDLEIRNVDDLELPGATLPAGRAPGSSGSPAPPAVGGEP